MRKRNNWFELIKEIIKDFSSLEFQIEAFHGRNNLSTDTDEMISLALDDYCVDTWLEKYSHKLTENLRKEMIEFISTMQDLPRHDENHKTVESVLLTPEWEKMRTLASSLLEQLDKLPNAQNNAF